jgi:hypothetical protein
MLRVLAALAVVIAPTAGCATDRYVNSKYGSSFAIADLPRLRVKS